MDYLMNIRIGILYQII